MRQPSKSVNIGDKYVNLTVMSKNYDAPFLRYNCKCNCGNNKIVRGQYLLNGKITSCGCKLDFMMILIMP